MLKLGFGCMRFPISYAGTPKEHIFERSSAFMLKTAYQNGVRYFDTAYPYHHGQSQEFVARVLRQYPRDSYLLANKLPTFLLKTESDVYNYFEEQLSVCKVDYFDYYLVHAIGDERWEKIIKPLKVYEKLFKLKQEGKIRKLGFSFHGSNKCLSDVVNAHKWDFVQIQLNYFDWYYQDAKTSYQILRDAGLPIIVMEPVRGGALARLCPQALELIQKSGYQGSPASLALRYVASLPGVETVLSGMSHKTQLYDNLNVFKDFKVLDEKEKQLVESVRIAYQESNSIPCTGCQYCQPCPQGVLIPDVFSSYNSFTQRQDIKEFQKRFFGMKVENGPRSCVECGKCVKLCPQAIAIPDKLKMVGAFASHHRID